MLWVQLYGWGMLMIGFAIGKHGTLYKEWLPMPWWAEFTIGCVMVVLAWILGRRQERKDRR